MEYGRQWNLVSITIIIVMMAIGIESAPPLSDMVIGALSPVVLFYALLFLAFVVFIGIFSREKVKGKKEIGNFKYFSMIFTCGMGVGLLSYGYNEVAILSTYSPKNDPYGIMLNHWTIIPWAMYTAFIIVNVYQENYVRMKSRFKDFRDTLFAVTSVIGITITVCVTANTVMNITGDFNNRTIMVIVILMGLMIPALLSTISGISKGITLLSNVATVMIIVFTVINIYYSQNFISNLANSLTSLFVDFASNNSPSISPDKVKYEWTTFYWLWWMTWCPFVSRFITIVSRGRSLQSVIVFTVIIPCILTVLFMVSGNSIGMSYINDVESASEVSRLAVNSLPIVGALFIPMVFLYCIKDIDKQSVSVDSMISPKSGLSVINRSLYVMIPCFAGMGILLSSTNALSTLQFIGYIVVPLILAFLTIDMFKVIGITLKGRK